MPAKRVRSDKGRALRHVRDSADGQSWRRGVRAAMAFWCPQRGSGRHGSGHHQPGDRCRCGCQPRLCSDDETWRIRFTARACEDRPCGLLLLLATASLTGGRACRGALAAAARRTASQVAAAARSGLSPGDLPGNPGPAYASQHKDNQRQQRRAARAQDQTKIQTASHWEDRTQGCIGKATFQGRARATRVVTSHRPVIGRAARSPLRTV